MRLLRVRAAVLNTGFSFLSSMEPWTWFNAELLIGYYQVHSPYQRTAGAYSQPYVFLFLFHLLSFLTKIVVLLFLLARGIIILVLITTVHTSTPASSRGDNFERPFLTARDLCTPCRVHMVEGQVTLSQPSWAA